MGLPISKEEATRLAKLLGMLGSSHAGERAAAALKADELVRRHGLTWRQVVVPTTNLITSSSSIPEKVALLGENLDLLNDWETGFVLSLHHFHRLSEKQLRVLNRLVSEVTNGRRAA